jgi:SAM-dependent methyltransferase
MPIIDRVNMKEHIAAGSPIHIELGCGTNKQKGYIGIDKLDRPEVDIVTDLENGLPFLPNSSVDSIYSSSFLEHVSNFELLMSEIFRVLKPNGTIEIFVPHFSNPYYYSDYTHKRFFGLYTFCYFCDPEDQFHRKVPAFYTPIRFRILEKKIYFHLPGYRRRPVKMFLTFLVNLSTGIQEFYEVNLPYILPCYGLHFILNPKKQ